MSRILTTLCLLIGVHAALPAEAATPPNRGDQAPDFTLSTVQGRRVQLSEVTAKNTVVLVVLRGYPGYQCPFCNRQVQDFFHSAQDFKDLGVRVLLVYPGPPQNLEDRANEFLADKHVPDGFELLLDPDYQVTNRYGLRWDAPNETAYPSTFLLDHQGVVFFSKISREHGGRTTAKEILGVLSARKSGQ